MLNLYRKIIDENNYKMEIQKIKDGACLLRELIQSEKAVQILKDLEPNCMRMKAYIDDLEFTVPPLLIPEIIRMTEHNVAILKSEIEKL